MTKTQITIAQHIARAEQLITMWSAVDDPTLKEHYASAALVHYVTAGRKAQRMAR